METTQPTSTGKAAPKKTRTPKPDVPVKAKPTKKPQTTQKPPKTELAGEAEFNLLSQTFKGCKAMADGIEAVKSMSSDKTFKNILNRQLKDYVTLAKEIEIYAGSKADDLAGTTLLDKAMTWGGLVIYTVRSKSPAKLAEIMLQNICSGVINVNRALNACDLSYINTRYADRFQTLLTANAETLKAYL